MINVNQKTSRQIAELKAIIVDEQGEQISTKKLIAIAIDLIYEKLKGEAEE